MLTDSRETDRPVSSPLCPKHRQQQRGGQAGGEVPQAGARYASGPQTRPTGAGRGGAGGGPGGGRRPGGGGGGAPPRGGGGGRGPRPAGAGRGRGAPTG